MRRLLDDLTATPAVVMGRRMDVIPRRTAHPRLLGRRPASVGVTGRLRPGRTAPAGCA
ncbi:hypothetical protein ACPEIC_29840 [Stenotrophomonas sp. NPDC087984]